MSCKEQKAYIDTLYEDWCGVDHHSDKRVNTFFYCLKKTFGKHVFSNGKCTKHKYRTGMAWCIVRPAR